MMFRFAGPILAAAVLMAPLAASAEKMRVVATFSILGDMVRQVGGDHVEVKTLVGPNGDTHVFRPSPLDARILQNADLLVVNGLGLEGWLLRLVLAAEFSGTRIVATDGIDGLVLRQDDADEDEAHKSPHVASPDEREHKHGESHKHGGGHGHEHGPMDPHAWQSPRAAALYVTNIANALVAADPSNSLAYQGNLAAYLAEIEKVTREVKAALDDIPDERRDIVTSHDAFRYFGREFGLRFRAAQGISTAAEPSAKDIARLIAQIRKHDIPAVFIENITDPRLVNQIAQETGARVGGTLYSGSLSGPDGPAGTYLDMIRHNAKTLAEALMPR